MKFHLTLVQLLAIISAISVVLLIRSESKSDGYLGGLGEMIMVLLIVVFWIGYWTFKLIN